MTDEATRLAAAINAIRGWGGGRGISVSAGHDEAVAMDLVLGAAEKHLATLPKVKTVWDLTASGRTSAPYERHAEADIFAAVIKTMAAFYEEGFARVVVTVRKVPT